MKKKKQSPREAAAVRELKQRTQVLNIYIERLRESSAAMGSFVSAMMEALEQSNKERAECIEEMQLLHLNCHNLTNKVAELLATAQATGKAN